MDNPFEFHEYDQVIACVGENGGTTDEDIRNGFKRTVEILTEAVKSNQEIEDFLVYPIVYNARHGIELSLKITIKKLWIIEEKKGIKYSVEQWEQRKRNLHTHDISSLYEIAYVKRTIDRRIPIYFQGIAELIQFYYFDVDGDAFKYESDKENEPHMIKNNISHISIQLLEAEFKESMKKFDELIYFLDTCIFEYSLGTFTKNLSRNDIMYISERVPNYEQWGTDEFKKIKKEIVKKYCISNKEFSKALKLIKENRRFSVNIGCEKIFGTITEDELKEYAKLVKYYCEKNEFKDLEMTRVYNLEKMQQNATILQNYLSKISMSTLNTLLCFYEMDDRELEVEKLDIIYEDIVKSTFNKLYIIRKLKKKRVCLKIIYGMEKCGQETYANQLKTALKLQGVSFGDI
jgi:hypothetical protein